MNRARQTDKAPGDGWGGRCVEGHTGGCKTMP